jgi:hypothetical protein
MVRSYYRFAVSLRRRSRRMQSGQHDETHALAMRLRRSSPDISRGC